MLTICILQFRKLRFRERKQLNPVPSMLEPSMLEPAFPRSCATHHFTPSESAHLWAASLITGTFQTWSRILVAPNVWEAEKAFLCFRFGERQVRILGIQLLLVRVELQGTAQN
jgi:hypothetical protein